MKFNIPFQRISELNSIAIDSIVVGLDVTQLINLRISRTPNSQVLTNALYLERLNRQWERVREIL